jgi:hypothetical protein
LLPHVRTRSLGSFQQLGHLRCTHRASFIKVELSRRLLIVDWNLQCRGRPRKSGGQQRAAPAKKSPDMLQAEYTGTYEDQLLFLPALQEGLVGFFAHIMCRWVYEQG